MSITFNQKTEKKNVSVCLRERKQAGREVEKEMWQKSTFDESG